MFIKVGLGILSQLSVRTIRADVILHPLWDGDCDTWSADSCYSRLKRVTLLYFGGEGVGKKPDYSYKCTNDCLFTSSWENLEARLPHSSGGDLVGGWSSSCILSSTHFWSSLPLFYSDILTNKLLCAHTSPFQNLTLWKPGVWESSRSRAHT